MHDISKYCYAQIPKKYPAELQKEAMERCKYELSVYRKSSSMLDEFALLKKWLDKEGYRTCAISGYGLWLNSIVPYLLDISEIDPIKYGLDFETVLQDFPEPHLFVPEPKGNEFESVRLKGSISAIQYSKDLRILYEASKATGVNLENVVLDFSKEILLPDVDSILRNRVRYRLEYFQNFYHDEIAHISYLINLEEYGNLVGETADGKDRPYCVLYSETYRMAVELAMDEYHEDDLIVQKKLLLDRGNEIKKIYEDIPIIKDHWLTNAVFSVVNCGNRLAGDFWKETARKIIQKVEESYC